MIIKQNIIDKNRSAGKFPDLFVSDKVKNNPKYIKSTVDFFQDVALKEYRNNVHTFCENYRFLKGDLRPADFYESDDEEMMGFYDRLTAHVPLPKYVQMYSILNMPVNTMWGEYIAKPDNTAVKAFDADSKSEELEYLTQMMMDYGTKMIQSKIYQKASAMGVDLEDPEVQAQLAEELQRRTKEEIESFATQGEKWSNRALESFKREFNLKDHAGQGFRDLLIAGRNRFHIYEDNSATGFAVENVNPRNVWKYMDPNEKYLKNAIYAGLIEVKDITDIMNRVKLTEDEIDQLRKESSDRYLNPTQYGSNLFNNSTGMNSITYNPSVGEQHRIQEQMYADQYADSEIMKDLPGEDLLMKMDGSAVMGQKHIVLTAYWQAKKKIGQLTYIDEFDEEQITLVNDTYVSGTHPGEIDLEWTYENEWWKGMKIGEQVYICEPLEILDYCPIIGIEFDGRNSAIKSLVDLMKPYQMIFNLCMNQLWELLGKEQGVTYEINQRYIPTDKDVPFEDSLEAWLDKAKNLGYTFTDDSLENMKVPSSTNTNTSKRIDLSRHQEMQSRLAICQQIKIECHALVGINQERLGGVAATQTATGTQAALSSSYSQTQIWFEAQENVMNQVYQATIDVAQYFESNKDISTISYLTDTGDRAFFEAKGSDLKNRDFRVFITSQTEDARKLEALRMMSQNFLQNGGDMYTVAKLQITNSIREIESAFKKAQERNEQQMAQAQQLEQQKIQQAQQATEAQLQQGMQIEAERVSNENYNKQMDRNSRERVAILNAAGRNPSVLSDNDNSGVADAWEITSLENETRMAQKKLALEQGKIAAQNYTQQAKVAADSKKNDRDYQLRLKELELKDKEIEQRREASNNSLKIAKTNKN